MSDKDKNNTSGRDPELESMLDSLRGDQPTALELKRWQRAVTDFDTGVQRKDPARKLWALVAAAAAIGALAGASITKQLSREDIQSPACNQEFFAEHRDLDATFETTYIKLD